MAICICPGLARLRVVKFRLSMTFGKSSVKYDCQVLGLSGKKTTTIDDDSGAEILMYVRII